MSQLSLYIAQSHSFQFIENCVQAVQTLYTFHFFVKSVARSVGVLSEAFHTQIYLSNVLGRLANGIFPPLSSGAYPLLAFLFAVFSGVNHNSS